jgi:hypothetical protein
MRLAIERRGVEDIPPVLCILCVGVYFSLIFFGNQEIAPVGLFLRFAWLFLAIAILGVYRIFARNKKTRRGVSFSVAVFVASTMFLGGLPFVLPTLYTGRQKHRILHTYTPKVSKFCPVIGHRLKDDVDSVHTHEYGHFKAHITVRNGRRITPIRDKSRKLIHMLGCSFTFGHGVEDNETYPWIIADMHPDLQIKNYGVSSYCPMRSLLQLREIKEKPDLITFGWIDWHQTRCAALSAKRYYCLGTTRHSPKRYPYAEIVGGEFRIRYQEEGDNPKPVPSRECARIAVRALKELYWEAQKRCPFLLILMPHSSDLESALMVREMAYKEGIPTIDLVKEGTPITFIPDDGHPDIYGQHLIAESVANHQVFLKLIK